MPGRTGLALGALVATLCVLADGSFHRLFRDHPTIWECLDRARLAERRVLELENPLLSPETPLDQARLRFRP